MNQSHRDQSFMRAALELAQRGAGKVEPNPMVGCLIVRDDAVIGSGFHRAFGGPHAEIEALQSCPDASEATAYVSLEPCCHHGKTPPCSEALIRAGIRRVVIAMEDPYREVGGRGIKQLRNAGIEVESGVLREESESLNAPYLKRIRSGLPWVIAKWAMTADGRIATATGRSQWITGPTARAEVHQLRRRVDGIAVGMGTVDQDDPLLTARPPGDRLLSRIVFCRRRLPKPDSQLMATAEASPVLLVVGPHVEPERLSAVRQPGVEILQTRSQDRIEMVRETLAELGQRDMTNLLLEGGGELVASFLEAGQIDEFHIYLGAKVFGGRSAPGPIGGVGITEVEQAVTLQLVSMDRFDDDLRAIYRKINRRHQN